MNKLTKTSRAVVAASFLASSTLMPIQASAQSDVESRVNCQGADGCVLPIGTESAGGAGWLLPALLGIAAIAGAIFILSDDDDDDDDIPVSP